MLVELAVLDGDDRPADDLGDLVQGDDRAVLRAVERGEALAVVTVLKMKAGSLSVNTAQLRTLNGVSKLIRRCGTFSCPLKQNGSK